MMYYGQQMAAGRQLPTPYEDVEDDVHQVLKNPFSNPFLHLLPVPGLVHWSACETCCKHGSRGKCVGALIWPHAELHVAISRC